MYSFPYTDSLKQGLTYKNNQAHTLLMFEAIDWTQTCCNPYKCSIHRPIFVYLHKIYSCVLVKTSLSNI